MMNKRRWQARPVKPHPSVELFLLRAALPRVVLEDALRDVSIV
jgi:hypothetical protein